MGLLRCFLAVELPAALQDAISLAVAGLRANLGSDLIRWVPPKNVHLTLKFLGDTAPSAVPQIEAALRAEVRQYEPFTVIVAGCGAFPSTRKPRVLWVGLTAPATLTSLQHELDVATARLGYSSEDRGFSPHLTLGRVRQTIHAAGLLRIREELERSTIGNLGSLMVDAVHLFESELGPGGSIYKKLVTAPLGAS